MAVTGGYIACRARASMVAYVRAYGEFVLANLLPAFGDLEERANEVANEEFEGLGSEPAGEDCDGDMSTAAEAAEAKGQVFYQTMAALRQATLNLFAAGLFHLLEQQLADLCRDGAFRILPPADTKLAVVSQWYQRYFALDFRSLEPWNAIDELRLVANAVKHGGGASERQLRKRRPELFEDPKLRQAWPDAPPTEMPLRKPLAGDDLYVTEECFREYHQAALRFVHDVARHFEANERMYYPYGG